MPNTDPPILDEESFILVKKLAKEKARCDYAIYVGKNIFVKGILKVSSFEPFKRWHLSYNLGESVVT